VSAAAPDGGPKPVQLGALLVQRGVLTTEQLAAALAEQRETRRPLGEVIVGRGFAPGPIVAQALATQHGGMVKTEYGYATAWLGGGNQVAAVEATPADPRDETIRELREWAATAQAAIAARDADIAQLRVKLDTPTVEDPRVAELTATVAALREKAAEPAAEDPRVAELTATLAELGASTAAHRESLAAAERELADASSRADTLASAVSEHEQTIAELRTALEATRARRWANAQAHLVFARGGKGYELVEQPGPPPAAGEVVDGRVVGRVSAMPGLDLPCAYLLD
jgi:hypothetical protein